MPYYLSEWEGAGTKIDPFVPVGSDQPGWTAVDIRAAGLNACLLHVPNAFSDPKAQFLGDDKLEGLTNPQKNFIQNKLGVDISAATTVRDAIALIMNNPPANGWKRLEPGFLRWEIWLGGELLWSAPRASGGATDDFNRANETPIALPWDSVTTSPSDLNLSSNTVVAGGGDSFALYTAAASSADQYSQLAASAPTSASGGPMCRMVATSVTGYLFDNFGSASNGEIRLWTNISSDSVLASGTIARANPLRIEAEGSTIRIYSNSVLSQTVTNSTLTTGQPGLAIYSNNFDNWEGGNLTPPSAPAVAPDVTAFPKYLLAGRSTV